MNNDEPYSSSNSRPLGALSALDTNYAKTANPSQLHATLVGLEFVSEPATKSQLATQIKTKGAHTLKAFGISGEDTTLVLNKTAVDISNHAVKCGIVNPDPAVFDSLELPTQLVDLQLLISS